MTAAVTLGYFNPSDFELFLQAFIADSFGAEGGCGEAVLAAVARKTAAFAF